MYSVYKHPIIRLGRYHCFWFRQLAMMDNLGKPESPEFKRKIEHVLPGALESQQTKSHNRQMDGQTKQSMEDDFCDKKEEATDQRIQEELKTNE